MDLMEKNYHRNELLEYPTNLQDANGIQKKWSKFIFDEKAPSIKLRDIHIVAGVDLTYLQKGTDEYGIACAVLWNLETNKEIAYEFAIEKVEFPYISGLLAFREIRIASLAIGQLTLIPDLIMFDGHGRAHPHRFGVAVAIGVALDLPSMGVAKRPLIGVRNWKNMKRKAGNKLLVIDNGEIVGYVMVLVDKLAPVFVSVGYKIDLETTAEIALKTALRHKQPECIGKAHEYLQKQKFSILSIHLSRCK